MSKWTKSGTATIVHIPPPPPERITDTDRTVSSYESIRSYATPRPGPKESFDERKRRLAKSYDECDKCGATRGERCYDLLAEPTKAFARGFHKGRPRVEETDRSAPMHRLPHRTAQCRCGEPSIEHRNREGSCIKKECKCRKFRPVI